MFVGYCDNCVYFDLVGDDSEHKCPRCSGTLRSLGINSVEWNKLPNEDKYNLSKIAERADEIRRRDDEKKLQAVKAEATTIEEVAIPGNETDKEKSINMIY